MRAWIAVLALSAQGCVTTPRDDEPVGGMGAGDAPDLSTPSRVDVLTQPAQAKLDVLWVIDASASMVEERPKLLDALPSFLDDLLDSGWDWHVGVVTMGEGPGRPLGALVGASGLTFLAPDTPNPVALLTQMASEEDTSGPGGQGFLAALDALTTPTPELVARNAGFLRDAAPLQVIVVSDQDDQSGPSITPGAFVRALDHLKSNPSTPVTFSAIVGDAPDGCDGADPGARYLAAVAALGGAVRSTCGADWADSVHATATLSDAYNREFFLSQLPDRSTMNVWVVDDGIEYLGLDLATLASGTSVSEACIVGQAANCVGYRYDFARNSVTFDSFVPSPGAQIHVRYQVLAAR